MANGPSERVYAGELVRIGRFRCRPGEQSFADSGPTAGHLMVFPREAVSITHADSRPIVADATRVMFYNRGQEYRRAAISPVGDRCEWFSFDAEAVHSAMLAHAPRATGLDRPFGDLSDGPSDAHTYLAQRRLYELVVAAGGNIDALLVEETALALLDRMVAKAWAAREPRRQDASGRRAHRDLADAARRLLAARPDEPMTLGAVADAVGASPFHLARVFRRETGFSLHAWRLELRCRAAIERVKGGEHDLTRLALELGFSSHSHFTATFRRVLGVAPSSLRARS